MATTATFRKEFIEMLGLRPDESDVRMAELKLKGADRAGIRSYISTFPEFRQRYEDIINRVYTISCDDAPDEDTVQFFLKRFAKPNYGPDDLADEIVNGVQDDGGGDAESAGATAGGLDVRSEAEDMLGFAKRWQTATGHKIDVYEFIRYFREGPDKKDISRAAEKQEAARAFVDKVHRDYLGRGVTRDEFLERYLFDLDKPHFEAEVMATVLGGEEYRLEMCKHLEKSNLKLFGVELHPDDLDHAFAVVRDKKAVLHGEEINEELIRTNDHMREICDAVNDVYKKTLDRPADADEVRECVSTFRAYGQDFAKNELATRLHDSLEFHDVIKDRFRASFEKKHGRKPKPREVYDALARALHLHAQDMSKALEDT